MPDIEQQSLQIPTWKVPGNNFPFMFTLHWKDVKFAGTK